MTTQKVPIVEFIIVNALCILGAYSCYCGMRLSDVGAFLPAKEALGVGVSCAICIICIITVKPFGSDGE